MTSEISRNSDASPASYDISRSRLSLLDILLLFAEDLKLLVFGPLVAATIALAALYVFPPTYASVSYLAVDDAGAKSADALMRTPDVLAAARRQLSGTATYRGPRDPQFLWTTPKGADRPTAKVFVLEVHDRDPGRAQAFNRALIEAWREATKPKAHSRARIEATLERSVAQLQRITRQLDGLERGISMGQSSDAVAQIRMAETFSSLLNLHINLNEKIDNLTASLNGLTSDVIISPPSLPTVPARKNPLVVLAAAFSTAILLMMLVLVREALRNMREQPATAAKLARLRIALRRRRLDTSAGAKIP